MGFVIKFFVIVVMFVVLIFFVFDVCCVIIWSEEILGCVEEESWLWSGNGEKNVEGWC